MGVMRDHQTEHLHWGKSLLFLSAFALTLATPFQEALNHECDKECFSLIQSTKSFLSLVMAVVFGMTSDIIKAEQVVLFVSVLNLCFNSVALSTKSHYALLALSIFASSSTNQTYVLLRALYSQTWNPRKSDVEKAQVFGQLGSTLSLSCVVGPLVGSFLFMSFEDTLLSTNMILLVCVYLACQLCLSSQGVRRKQSDVSSVKTSEVSHKHTSMSLDSMKQSLVSPEILLLLTLKFCMAFSYGLFLPVWREILLNTFHFSPQDHSIFLVLTALAYTIFQRFMPSIILQASGEHHDYVLVFCVVVLSLGRLVLAFSTSLVVVSLCMLSLVMALVTTNTLLTIASTNLTQKEVIGSVYGLLDFTENFAGILSPLVGAVILKNDVYLSLGGVCVSYLCFSILVLKFFNKFFIRKVVKEQHTIITAMSSVKKKMHKRTKSPTSVIFIREETDELIRLSSDHTRAVKKTEKIKKA